MTIGRKLVLAILPLVLAAIFALGWWHYQSASDNLKEAGQLYLDTVLSSYLETEVKRRHASLVEMGVDNVPSFVERYQAEAITMSDHLAERYEGDFVIIDGQGRLLHATGILAGGVPADNFTRNREMTATAQGLAHIHMSDGDKEIGLLVMQREFAPWRWRIAFAMTDKHYHYGVDHILISTAAMAGFLMALIVSLMYLVSRKILLQPIECLRQAAECITHNKPVGEIPLHCNDELGLLARNMELMAKTVNRSREELEQQVRERTLELQQENQQRREAQQALEVIGEKLRHSNRDLQDFAYIASHDMQEPLRMIISYLQLLTRRYHGRLDADADEFIGFAMDGARRLNAMIEGLLQYSRIETQGGNLRLTDLEEPLNTALANLQLKIQETGAAITRAPLPRVRADANQISSLFQNLIGNALKFHGAEVPRIDIGCERKGDTWEISVRDNGIGFEPKNAERIFTMFQRLHTRAEYAGTGIGLAVCKRIVERHGGKISVESSPGQGARFYFSLPAGDDSA